MDANRDYKNSQLSYNIEAEGYPEGEGDFNPSFKMNNKPKIPMSYYFPEGQATPGNNYNMLYKTSNMNMGMPYEEERYGNIMGYKNMMGNMKMSNINNMNINIINQIPMQTGNNYMMQGNLDNEEFINNFSKLNLKKESGYAQKSKKDMAYNYYFGNPGAESNSIDNSGIGSPSNYPDEAENENSYYSYQMQMQMNQPKPYFDQGMPNRMGMNQNQNYQGTMNMKPNLQFNNDNFYNKHGQKMNPKGQFGGHNQGQGGYNNKNYKNHGDNMSGVNRYNSPLNIQPSNIEGNNMMGRYFVLKSIDEDNIHKSIKYRIWCSTIKGNQKLQKAFKEADNKYPIYLFFSVNGSGRFLGLAQMTSEVEYRANFNYWTQNEKWKGFFFLVWLTIKDIPNRAFRQIINDYNDNKSVTASRDTQEIYPAAGAEMLKIFSEYPYETSILDDFKFYEQKQDTVMKVNPPPRSKEEDSIYPGKESDEEHDGSLNNMNVPSKIINPPDDLYSKPMNIINQNRNYEGGITHAKPEIFSNQKFTPNPKPIKRIIKRVNSTENIMNSKKDESNERGN